MKDGFFTINILASVFLEELTLGPFFMAVLEDVSTICISLSLLCSSSADSTGRICWNMCDCACATHNLTVHKRMSFTRPLCRFILLRQY